MLVSPDARRNSKKKKKHFLSAVLCIKSWTFYVYIWFVDQSESGVRSHHVAVSLGSSFGAALIVVVVIGFWWRYRRNQQIFFDVNGNLLRFLCTIGLSFL